jgi:predicted phage terminase large subunit-like protein
MYKAWDPDDVIIEKKAAGAPLLQELRQSGLLIAEVSPSRGKAGVSKDKRARVNAVAPVLQGGVVWHPDRRWAYEVIDECSDFPNGEHDDFTDCVQLALDRFRRGGFLSLKGDAPAEPEEDVAARRRHRAYY